MTAKDSRYSCLVLFMSFLSHVCHLGFSYGVVGNLTIAHQQAFNISLQQSSLLGSVFVATFYLLGFGMSLCLSSSTEVLPQHFDKYRNLAFAIASSGVMVGVIIWPIASQYFLSIYSYSKAIGIIAAFQIIHSLAGLTFISGNREDVTKEKPGETSANGVLSANNDQVAVSTVCKDERHSPSQESSEKTKVTSEGELPPPQSQSLRKSFTTLLKSYNVWFLLIHAMLRMGGSTIFAVMINKYVIAAVGLTSGEAAFGIALTGGGSLIGCVLVAATGTIKYDRVILHTCVVALNAVMTIILAYITSKVK
ncbi:hypothetical protein EB796_020003 [Bugula neritina]|uniref:Uncharacterized protein n=1 Tax=Bugula neritina TaxID=10212 RepID=A0A7J7J7F2_BUGNE|nr:hypothetical protein EB796_020003 [Bugula neritina]